MEKRVKTRAVGTAGVCLSIASIVLNIILATNIGSRSGLSALRALLFVAFGLNLVAVAVLIGFCTLFVKRLDTHTLGSKRNTWCLVIGGVIITVASIVVSGGVLIWLVVKQNELPARILSVAPVTLIGIWFAAWAAASVLQIAVYSLLHPWARRVLTSQRASRLNMDFRSRAPSMTTIARPATHHTNRSFGSQELTLNSPPRTPVSKGEPATHGSSATNVGTMPSKLKLARYSNRSSLEAGIYPAGDSMSIDSAFDSWDTSSVHREMRAAIHSSPSVTHIALETIPGSRPESTEIDEACLPESPLSSSPPHAATSDMATTIGWSSSPRQPKSSEPPSSPINFSRPTSRPTSSHNSKPPPKVEAFDSSMQDLIHPLFRPNSPHPPPIVTSGSMVTASPMANSLITPKTLARLRTNSSTGPHPEHPTELPSIGGYDDVYDDESVPDSPTLGSPSLLGSPGPSIVEDPELPPILPGFVLSAGTRSSLVEYGKRKSVKGSRLSQAMT